MDDQFLPRLRREPTQAFATRLKWQLDRPMPVPVHRFRSRLILALAVCGTAFALISPPGRRALGDWFATTTGPSQTAPPEISAPMPAAPGAAGSPRGPRPGGVSQPRYGSAVPSFPAPQPAPVPAAAELPADTIDTQSAARTAFVPVAIVAGLPAQTPEMQAARAVSLRQGLFKTMGFVMQPVAVMLRRDGPLDMGVIRLSATRLVTLSSLIPEVFSPDTRPFETDSRAQDRIWTDPKDFESKADDLDLAAEALAESAATGDDIAARRAIVRIGAACTGCHDVFRKK
jgi:cytochrome c556